MAQYGLRLTRLSESVVFKFTLVKKCPLKPLKSSTSLDNNVMSPLCIHNMYWPVYGMKRVSQQQQRQKRRTVFVVLMFRQNSPFSVSILLVVVDSIPTFGIPSSYSKDDHPIFPMHDQSPKTSYQLSVARIPQSTLIPFHWRTTQTFECCLTSCNVTA